MRSRQGLLVCALATVALLCQGAGAPPDLLKVKMGNLAFPSLISIILAVIKDQGLDRKNGLDLEIHPFSAPSAQLAAQATGETDAGPNGPLILHRMRLEGAPLQAVTTLATLSAMVVITANPQIKSIQDLRGKTLAADVGSAEFQILATYARHKGLDLQRDATVVVATPPLARTQLAARRADAAMTWEPAATLTMRDSADYRVIFNGGTGWREITGEDGWELVISMREDVARRNPQAVTRLVETLQDAQRFITTNLDDADRIVARSANLPPGVLKEAVQAGRVVYDVRGSWAPGVRDSLWNMFKAAVGGGYLKAMPDPRVIYTPN